MFRGRACFPHQTSWCRGKYRQFSDSKSLQPALAQKFIHFSNHVIGLKQDRTSSSKSCTSYSWTVLLLSLYGMTGLYDQSHFHVNAGQRGTELIFVKRFVRVYTGTRIFLEGGTVKQHTTASASNKQEEALLTAERRWVPTGCHPAWGKAGWSASQETLRIKTYIPSFAFLSQSGQFEGFNHKAYTGGRAGELFGAFFFLIMVIMELDKRW